MAALLTEAGMGRDSSAVPSMLSESMFLCRPDLRRQRDLDFR